MYHHLLCLRKQKNHDRTSFPSRHRAATNSRSLRRPLLTELRTYRRASSNIHTPLFITTPLNIVVSPVFTITRRITWKCVQVGLGYCLVRVALAAAALLQALTLCVLRHYNNAAAAWQRCRQKRRSGGDSLVPTRPIQINKLPRFQKRHVFIWTVSFHL